MAASARHRMPARWTQVEYFARSGLTVIFQQGTAPFRVCDGNGRRNGDLPCQSLLREHETMVDNHVKTLATDILISMQGTEDRHHGEICVQCVVEPTVNIRRELTSPSGTWERKRWVIWLEGVTDRSSEQLLLDTDCIGVVKILTGKETSAVILELENARAKNSHARLRVQPLPESE